MKTGTDAFKPYIGLTCLIGFGFFTVGLMDPLYDSYVQIYLSKYIDRKSVIGVLMSIDNLFALFLIPVVSVWSDRTRTAIGRRMPWIVTLLPLSALCFALVPYAAEASLVWLVLLLVALNLFKQSARGPVVALMPDLIPGEYRSQANGVINMMGNVAAIAGTLFLARLMDVDAVLPILGKTKDRLAFPAAGLFVTLATVLLLAFVRERSSSRARPGGESLSDGETPSGSVSPDGPDGPDGPDRDDARAEPFLRSFRTVFLASDRSGFFVLVSLFLWFVGYQGVVPYLTEYSIRTFGLSTGQGPFAMGMVGIASAIAAVPAGYAANRWGRRRVIRVSLLAVAAVTACVFVLGQFGGMGGLRAGTLKYAFWGLMAAYGVFWIAIVANSFPMLWQMASFERIGAYTGLYYTFSQLAAIVAPAASGALMDAFGPSSMFLFCSVFFLLAFGSMGFVRSGEKDDSPAA